MKAKQKKRLITCIVLVVVLGALIGAYFIVSNMNFDEDTETTPSTSVTLVAENSAAASAITYTHDGEELHFVREENGMWYYDSDRDFPVNQSYLTEMAQAVSSVTASRELTGGDTGEYGFDAPSLTVSADFTTGNTYTLILGNTNSFNSSVYIKDASGKVCMFNDTLTEKFNYALFDLIQLDSPEADVDTSYLVSLDVTTDAGEFKSITDSAGMNELLSQSDVYECTDWIEYGMTAEEFAGYGIKDGSPRLVINYKAPVAVTDADGNTTTQRIPAVYEIIFGNKLTAKDADGNDAEYIYYTVTGSDILYKQPIADYYATMEYVNYTEKTDTEEVSSPDTEEASTDVTTADTEA